LASQLKSLKNKKSKGGFMQKKSKVLWLLPLIPLLLILAAGCGPDYRLDEVIVDDIEVDFQPLIEKPRIILKVDDKGKKLTLISLDATAAEITLARSVQKGDKITLGIVRSRQFGNIVFKNIVIISKAPPKTPEPPKVPEKKGWSLFK
jgi:hypothetical protein